MNIYIRTDSSTKIGSGHLMRCLTLAENLKENGACITFICRDVEGSLVHLVQQAGYNVEILMPEKEPVLITDKVPHALWLETTWDKDVKQTIDVFRRLNSHADWLIVDHYSLDHRWESAVRAYTKKIMVIDDLADRVHDCDVLLDQNLYKQMEGRYQGLVPDYCQKLLGPEFALLRPEFLEVRKNLKKRDESITRILVFYGGSDITDETSKALDAIKSIEIPSIKIDVVVGKTNPYKSQIEQICSEIPNTTYYCQVNNMAELMAAADLAIGAGGTATWERCFLGLPSIVTVIAENQVTTVEAVAERKAIINLGWHSDVTVKTIAEVLTKTVNNPEMNSEMVQNAFEIMKNRHLYGSAPAAELLLQKNIL